MENTSGGGSTASVPPEVDRWNWGAFLLTWIWGIGNNVLIALLMFVPFVNIVMWFVLGAKGSAWAWRNRRWASVEAFRQTQRNWAIAGAILFVVVGVFMVGGFWAISSAMKHSGAYELAVKDLQQNPEVVQQLGSPMSTGIPTGQIQVSGPSGTAHLSFSVQGSKGKGTVYVEATKAIGRWHLDQAVFENDATEQRIDLIPKTPQ
ncbi:cytochrome c oxidase assembly factor Coa1 family protein [Dyella sp.]|uniref:cytochrome c oxidase assembly factor Coa1 family protein n=1 Tax=Dyella sp. TaxID=1869338 RepID=UPI002ED1CA20